MKPIHVILISVVPSPYQRDLFLALSERSELNLNVYYLETAAPDSPWNFEGLRPFERVLPGICFGKGQVRSHFNWQLPNLQRADLIVLNTSITDVTTQWLMRKGVRGKPWVFWAEVNKRQSVGWKQRVSQMLYAPLKKATALIGIGKGAQEAYRELFPGKQVYNVPYHIKAPQCQPQRHVVPASAGLQTVRFLFCGQMIYRKAVDVLLAAFVQVIEAGLDARLQMVGREADLDEFLKEVPDSVQSAIDLLGFRQPAELPEIFAAADVFVLPSRRDGWGVVVNQAVSAGLPVIASDAVGAAKELVVEGENGYCVPAGEAQPLADAMLSLAKDAGLRQRFGEKSLSLAESITPAAGAEKMAGILCDI